MDNSGSWRINVVFDEENYLYNINFVRYGKIEDSFQLLDSDSAIDVIAELINNKELEVIEGNDNYESTEISQIMGERDSEFLR
jgi:hypothetical protein